MNDERAKEVAGELRCMERQYRQWSKSAARQEDRKRDGAKALAFKEAADELERLREESARLQHERDAEHDAGVRLCGKLDAKDAEIAQLRRALKPFAAQWEWFKKDYAPTQEPTIEVEVPLADCKRAAEALE